MPTTNPVPSTDPTDLLFNAGKLDEVVSGDGQYYTDRLGVNRRTMEGISAAADVVLGGIGYAPPVTYAAGISMTLTTQTVEYSGEVYAPNVGNLPFTTSGTFETAKFRLIQGVAATDLAASGGAAMVGYMPSGIGAVATTVQSKLREAVSVKDFGAKGDGVTDDTTAILAAKSFCIANLPITLRFPKGTYVYTELGNWAYEGLTLEGDGKSATKLKCVNSSFEHTALLFNAFLSGSPTDQFVNNCNVRKLTVEGNSNTLRVILAQGIARSHWIDVDVRSAKAANGFGFLFEGCSINQFDNLSCVNFPANPMSSTPRYGMYLTNGYRAGVDIGQCTNNVFVNAQMEYLPIGTQLNIADNNTFIGGTDESCTVYGCYIVNGTNRYNTFIGRAWENQNATADVLDGGSNTQFINCYSLKSILFQGNGAKLSGGVHERIEVQGAAVKNCLENFTVKYLGAGSGGFFDNGTATEWKNIYDKQTSQYIYPLKARVGLSVDSSPFTWQNTTGQYVELIIQSGTLQQVRRYRDGVTFLCSTVTPNSIWLAPLETIEVSFSVTPSISYLPHNGFQG